MALRLYRYMDRIWTAWLADHDEAKLLPPIPPMVLYHGETQWSAERYFESLVDLGETPDALATAFTKLTVLFLKHARHEVDFLPCLVEWCDLIVELLEAPSGVNALGALMRDALEVNETLRVEAAVAVLGSAVGRRAKEAMVTAGESLIEEGRQDLLLKLLRFKFRALPSEAAARVRAARGEQLEIWAERVLVATSPKQVFDE